MNPVQKARWYVESHSRIGINLADVADASGVSPYHLTRAFSEVFGMSVMRYARRRRLTEAAKQLVTGASPILNLAIDNGYGSHEAFSRAFKEEFGVTPESVRTLGTLASLTHGIHCVFELPFEESSFDVVFAHALFEHISSPTSALAEIRRVLAPNGVLAIRSPDWGGFLVVPELPGVSQAVQAYADQQIANGGDIHVGRKLPELLRAAGFDALRFTATYDCSLAAPIIADYFALAIPVEDGDAMRRWGQHKDATFAQCWCEILGKRTEDPQRTRI